MMSPTAASEGAFGSCCSVGCCAEGSLFSKLTLSALLFADDCGTSLLLDDPEEYAAIGSWNFCSNSLTRELYSPRGSTSASVPASIAIARSRSSSS